MNFISLRETIIFCRVILTPKVYRDGGKSINLFNEYSLENSELEASMETINWFHTCVLLVPQSTMVFWRIAIRLKFLNDPILAQRLNL